MLARACASLATAVLVVGLISSLARAAPLEWLPVESPVYEELDRLETEGMIDTTVSLGARPLARADVARIVAHVARANPDRLDHPGLVRLLREFSRELARFGYTPVEGSTPPLIRYPPAAVPYDDERDETGLVRVIPYLDAVYERRFDGRGRLADRSRAGLRIGIELGDVLLYQDLYAGRFDGGRAFADPLVEDTDFIHFIEDTYVSARTRWLDLSLGRTRHAWGPGRFGSLLWSEEAGPVTFFSWGKALLGGKLRGTAIHADVNAARDARLAAHRLEITPIPSLSVGFAEAARYSSPQWEPLYVLSIVPFTVVQRFLAQDAHGDSGRSVRNNVIISADARWRVLPGTTLYGEVLFDDLTFKTSGTPVRIGYQFGWLGVGRFLDRRLSWRGEFTRVHRFVYSVFYDENFIHQDRPIGFPAGPDSRSLQIEAQYDLGTDWSLLSGAAQVDRGEGRLGEFFDPTGPPQKGSEFKGVVERARSVEAGAAWQPRDGVFLRALWRYRWRENPDQVDGDEDEDWAGRLEVRLRH